MRKSCCALAPVAVAYVEHDLFLEQSKFDHWQLWQEAGIGCMTEQAYTPPWNGTVACNAEDTAAIIAYGEAFMAQVAPLRAAPGSHRGMFLTSCVVHGQDWHYASIGDTNLQTAFSLWYHYRHLPNATSTLGLDNDFQWVEDLRLPRTDNPLACPPFTFAE
jgi:hypothetical protein